MVSITRSFHHVSTAFALVDASWVHHILIVAEAIFWKGKDAVDFEIEDLCKKICRAFHDGEMLSHYSVEWTCNWVLGSVIGKELWSTIVYTNGTAKSRHCLEGHRYS